VTQTDCRCTLAPQGGHAGVDLVHGAGRVVRVLCATGMSGSVARDRGCGFPCCGPLFLSSMPLALLVPVRDATIHDARRKRSSWPSARKRLRGLGNHSCPRLLWHRDREAEPRRASGCRCHSVAAAWVEALLWPVDCSSAAMHAPWPWGQEAASFPQHRGVRGAGGPGNAQGDQQRGSEGGRRARA
jgi:hypothetical protein